MRFKVGDFVTHNGLTAQVETVFHDKGLDGARICYFPQPGAPGPGWPLVRQDALEPWDGPQRFMNKDAE